MQVGGVAPGREQGEGRVCGEYGGRVFRVGDKVTQLRNGYDKGQAGIFNGTVGVVTALSHSEQTLTALTDEDERVGYDFAELDELAHAVTIHRSQGSENPTVMIPLTTSSWMMLQRNLLYTGVTRAKQLLILADQVPCALAHAVRTRGAGRRHSAPTGSPRWVAHQPPAPQHKGPARRRNRLDWPGRDDRSEPAARVRQAQQANPIPCVPSTI